MGVAPVAAGLSIAGGVTSAYGQIQGGRTQARLAAHNRRVAEAAAADERRRGEAEEIRHRRSISRFLGRQRTAVAASGAVVDEGTAFDILEDTVTTGEIDVLTIRNNATRRANGFEAQAFSFGQEARMARLAGTLGAFGSLLTGGTQAFSANQAARLAGVTPRERRTGVFRNISNLPTGRQRSLLLRERREQQGG